MRHLPALALREYGYFRQVKAQKSESFTKYTNECA